MSSSLQNPDLTAQRNVGNDLPSKPAREREVLVVGALSDDVVADIEVAEYGAEVVSPPSVRKVKTDSGGAAD